MAELILPGVGRQTDRTILCDIAPYTAPVSIMGEGRRAILDRIRSAQMSAVLCFLVAIVTGVSGYLIGSSRERHAAVAVVLTGTVTWSNEDTRLIAVERDGVVRRPDDGDTIYSVLIDDWQDAEGTVHADNIYPTCLASEDDSPVSVDRHHVELTVIDGDTGSAQHLHVAVRIRCLD
jgi:hypothetical protein